MCSYWDDVKNAESTKHGKKKEDNAANKAEKDARRAEARRIAKEEELAMLDYGKKGKAKSSTKKVRVKAWNIAPQASLFPYRSLRANSQLGRRRRSNRRPNRPHYLLNRRRTSPLRCEQCTTSCKQFNWPCRTSMRRWSGRK